MTNRELAALYRAVAKSIDESLIPEEAKGEVINRLCENLQANSERFNRQRFIEACWGELW